MPVLLNASPEVLNCQHGGMHTIFRPSEQKELFDVYAARHLINRWGKYGLVELSFGEKESKKYDDFDEYVHYQKVAGMKAYVESLKEKVYRFELYDEECGDKKSIERRNAAKLADETRRKLKVAEEMLSTLQAMDPRKTPEEKARLLREKARQLEAEAAKLVKKSSGENVAKSA